MASGAILVWFGFGLRLSPKVPEQHDIDCHDFSHGQGKDDCGWKGKVATAVVVGNAPLVKEVCRTEDDRCHESDDP